jgi:hypothetical protein
VFHNNGIILEEPLAVPVKSAPINLILYSNGGFVSTIET